MDITYYDSQGNPIDTDWQIVQDRVKGIAPGKSILWTVRFYPNVQSFVEIKARVRDVQYLDSNQ
jgi:hypothetical protein